MKKRIGILTGGGDVPGLNPAIRGVTLRALKEGFEVIGIRRGWGGMVNIIRDKEADNSQNYRVLTEEIVNKIGRTGGTFLHSSRTKPSHVKLDAVPAHLKEKYTAEVNDLTPEVLKNLDFLGIDYLIPIGGDDTLSYGVTLHKAGFKVVGIPKTMDNDVPGTDYCIGFSTCVTRTLELTHALRTSAGSHERFLVIEVFGRYAGFSALLPALAGASDRCLIPEYKFNMENLAELMVRDRLKNPSRYAVVLVSEGAMMRDHDQMLFQSDETDAYGHKKLGGIGDVVAKQLKDLSGKYNNGQKVNVIGQKLGYLVRCGDPDAFDSIVPMAYGNNAFELILKGRSGLLVNLRNGIYGHTDLEVVTSTKKVI
ncbi:MAG: ATP-dependent 6-phosphofructokinase, partial [Candidatus Neomarinimicrobiota bacterium]